MRSSRNRRVSRNGIATEYRIEISLDVKIRQLLPLEHRHMILAGECLNLLLLKQNLHVSMGSDTGAKNVSIIATPVKPANDFRAKIRCSALSL